MISDRALSVICGVVFDSESENEVYFAIGFQTAVLEPVNRLKNVVLMTHTTTGHESYLIRTGKKF